MQDGRKVYMMRGSLVPRPLPDFISQLWRKITRRPGNIAMSRAGKWWTRLVRNVDSVYTNWVHHFRSVMFLALLLIFLHGCKKSGLGTRLMGACTNYKYACTKPESEFFSSQPEYEHRQCRHCCTWSAIRDWTAFALQILPSGKCNFFC